MIGNFLAGYVTCSQPRAVLCGDDTNHVVGDFCDGRGRNLKNLRIDAVGARRDDRELRAAFSPVLKECPCVLIRFTGNFLGKDPSVRDALACSGDHNSKLSVLDGDEWLHLDCKLPGKKPEVQSW